MDHVLFPRFWKEEPALWFAQVEAVFKLNNITSDTDKYDYILCELPSTIIRLIKDLILDTTTEFEGGKYRKIKKELIKRISITELEKEEIGSKKPSDFYKCLQEKADPRISESILKEIWLKKLPLQVNNIICDMKGDMESACKLADTVKEYVPVSSLSNKKELTSPTADESKLSEILGRQLNNVCEELHKFKKLYGENNSQLEKIQAEFYKFKLTYSENNTRLENIQAELQQIKSAFLIKNNNDKRICYVCMEDRSHKNVNELDQTDNSISQNDKSSVSEGDESKNDSQNKEPVSNENEGKNETETKTDTLCWYHAIYGNNAHNCLPPCNFKNQLATGLK